MSSYTKEQVISAITDAGLEEQFLKVTGLSSLDELSPANFSENFGKADSLMKQVSLPSAAPTKSKAPAKSDADASQGQGYQEASDYLQGFKHITVRFPPRRQASCFIPDSKTLFLLTHIMNNILVDHFYFKRSAPDYHPGLLRIYIGILFLIQTLRAQHAADQLESREQYEFLKRILDSFPCESLPVPAPLLHVFKSLTASSPEIPQYGLVTPKLPLTLGQVLNNGPYHNYHQALLPDIAGILSMIAQQHTLKEYKKGFVPTFSTTADTSFRGFTFDKDPAQWDAAAAWSLYWPGIDHPFESGKKLNEEFFEDRYEDLGLPSVGRTNNLSTIEDYTYLSGNLTWFSRVRDIASAVCKFFPGSGTLADCPAVGLPVGQVQVSFSAPATLPTQPTKSPASSTSNMDMAFTLRTTSRTIGQLPLIMAAAAGVHTRSYATHPIYGTSKSRDSGPFWDIRPIEKSSEEENLFFSMTDSMKKAVKDKAI